jgi:hypothetical protein
MNRRTALLLLPALSFLYLDIMYSRRAYAGWPGQGEVDEGHEHNSDNVERSGWPNSSRTSPNSQGSGLNAIKGCSLHGRSFDKGEIKSILAPDRFVPQQLQVKSRQFNNVLSNIYELSPGVAFIMDGGAPNAFATPENLLSDSKDGSILLGLNLFQSEYNNGPNSWEGAAVLIHAHEFGHIAEYKFGYTGPVPLMELQADALAGCAMAHQFMNDPARTITVGQRSLELNHACQSVFSKGSYDFNDPNFHGTPQQRLTAFQTGFQYIINSTQQRQIRDAMDKTRAFAERILS